MDEEMNRFIILFLFAFLFLIYCTWLQENGFLLPVIFMVFIGVIYVTVLYIRELKDGKSSDTKSGSVSGAAFSFSACLLHKALPSCSIYGDFKYPTGIRYKGSSSAGSCSTSLTLLSLNAPMAHVPKCNASACR